MLLCAAPPPALLAAPVAVKLYELDADALSAPKYVPLLPEPPSLNRITCVCAGISPALSVWLASPPVEPAA